ncbi:YqaE/Pmp3 family membrane protein [Methylobacterium sp. C25]|uniref:YqaE/Pmp3 family membrane protein n=1 Tax=Methylobacterium sp. C25 TaxID=2721622 RepID=UPI001F2C935B|nr:YqaE/Pmp3 family membrane protein [Methylobacterium sp. C25]MCE4225725.1 YqaE/Pmp3 family membrane protein [Methylobacterium sp. C25]
MSTLIQILIAFFLPPISVLMTNGFGLQFLLNVLLCLLFYLPGSFHALYLLLRDR